MVSRSVIGRVMILFLAVAVVPAWAQPLGNLVALNQFQPGLWELRGEGEPVRNLCLIDPAELIQLRHRGNSCSRFVIADGKAGATVHYSCAGAGWGRTTVRLETPRLVRIDSQGIADNAPFAFVAEARRIGECPGRAADAVQRPRR